MKRRFRQMIWGFFCALFLAVGIPTPEPGLAAGGIISATGEDPAEDLTLHASSAVLMDADTGRVLYGRNADEPMAMASTTKIMTCIVILENVPIDEVLTVSSYASGMPKVKLYIRQGEQYTVRDLLYSLMLESHNDSAVALAEHLGKKFLSPELAEKPAGQYTAEESKKAVAAFAALMNQKAAELGCRDSWFITPNGLDAVQSFTLADGTVIQKEHCTTAAELALIMAYCIGKSPQSQKFLEITRTPAHSFSANGRSFSCVNHNAFLNMMEGSLSGKTGFTNKAGYCYVGALRRDGRTFVVALLACGWPDNKTWKWRDTKELMGYGLRHYFYRSFLEEGTAFDEGLLKPVPVAGGQTEILGETAWVNAIIKKDGTGDDGMGFAAVGQGKKNAEGLLLREDEEIRVEYDMVPALEAPVEEGMRIGTVEYSVGGVVYRQDEIVTAGRVEKIDIRWCAEQILARFLP